MNNTYEINLKPSIYQTNVNEPNDIILIFELILKGQNNQNLTKRFIKTSRKDTLISENDNINYNLFDTMDLTIINPDNINNIITITNHKIKNNFLKNNNILIQINNLNKYLVINYQFNLFSS
jgi:hypothetical protein